MAKSKELKIMRKKIEKADKLANPLERIKSIPADLPFDLPSHKLDAAFVSSESSKPFDLQVLSSPELTNEIVHSLLCIFEDNMGELYRVSSWGLDMTAKKEELCHRKARFLLLWSGEDTPSREVAAYVHYRFCFDDDERPDYAVLYCYEIQVQKAYQRRRVGRALMQLLEEVGRETNMSKVMLTVFFKNAEALKFYQEGMGYTVDESSPSQYKEAADYEILSKVL